KADSREALLFFGPPFLIIAPVYLVPGLVGGIGLLQAKPWARMVILALSALLVLLIPAGTLLGGFGLWVLLGSEAKRVFAARMPAQHPAQAPALTQSRQLSSRSG